MKGISIVLNNFLNDSRVLKEAITLKEMAGYDITVVALHEDNLMEKEIVNGINVHRINLKTRHWSTQTVIQILKYLEFAYKVIKQYRNVDYIHCNDLGPLPISILIKKISKNRVKIIYDAHEYETERNGLKGLRKKITSIVERMLIKNVDEIITVSNSIAKEYTRLYNVKKPSLVLNCPKYQEVHHYDKFREKFNIDKDSKIFLYQGALSKGRGIDIILEAFATIDVRAELIVMGYGPMKNEVIEYTKKYNNIFFHEAVSPHELLSYTSSADVGICMIEDVCLSYKYSLPNKFFEYGMASLPIITNNLIEVQEITEKFQCGWILKQETPLELKRLVEQILSEDISKYKKNSKKMSKDYNWEKQEVVLLDVYKGLLQ